MGDFKLYAQLEAFEKAGEEHPMRIGGIVSTDELDQDGERIIQEGLDFNHFLNSGWFNDNHKQGTADVVGYPTGAKYVRKGAKLPNGRRAQTNGWWAEGYLVDTQKGREIWGLVQSLSKGPRRLGFSIEGKVKARDPRNPSIVARAQVRNVAVTHCPVNLGTELNALTKALSAGADIANPGVSPGSAFPLRAESLEGSPVIVDGDDFTDEPTTTEDEVHATTEDWSTDEGGELIGKGDDFVIEPMTELQYLQSWIEASGQVPDAEPEGFTEDEARLIVKAERPYLSDDAVDRVIKRARAQEHA